jgi:hypothetical protein
MMIDLREIAGFIVNLATLPARTWLRLVRYSQEYRVYSFEDERFKRRARAIVSMLADLDKSPIRNPEASFILKSYSDLLGNEVSKQRRSVRFSVLEKVLADQDELRNFDNAIESLSKRQNDELRDVAQHFRSAGGRIQFDLSEVGYMNNFKYGFSGLSQEEKEAFCQWVKRGALSELRSRRRFVEMVEVVMGLPVVKIGKGLAIVSEFDPKRDGPVLIGVARHARTPPA